MQRSICLYALKIYPDARFLTTQKCGPTYNKIFIQQMG